MFTAAVILLLLAQAAEPERVVLTGTIAGADGKPAAEAQVVLAEGSPPLTALARRTGAVLRPPAVLRRQEADANGRFRVGLPADDMTIQRFRRPLFLWAFGPGGSLALRPIPDNWPPDGEPVRLTLAPSEPVRCRVLDPDERPVAGARLIPARLRGVDVPVDLGGRFEVQTDALGRGTFGAGAAGELEVIRVISGPFGVQQHRVTRPDAEGVRTLRLLPVGRVVGQILAGDLQAVRGLTVRVRTDPDPSADVAGVGGWASVVSDDQGRFTVPAIAAGTLAVSVDLRWDMPWRSPPLSRPQVQPATTTEVTIALKPAARITGVVQEIPSGRPVAGVRVAVAMDAETLLAPSDAEGRFSAYVAPGMARSYPVGMPHGYYHPTNFANDQPVPEGVKEVTLKPLGLSRGLEVRGQVVNAQGKPVPGTDVSGHYDLSNRFERSIHAVTDREGRFRIESVPPDTTLHLSASRGGATTAAPESIAASKGSITLKISPENAVALYGRVKDPEGRPLAGAAVRVSAPSEERKTSPSNSSRSPSTKTAAPPSTPTPTASSARRASSARTWSIGSRSRPTATSRRAPSGSSPTRSGSGTSPPSCSSRSRRRARWPAGWSTPRAGRSPARACSSRATGRHACARSATPTAASGCRESTASRHSSSSRVMAWLSRDTGSNREPRRSS